MSSFLIRIDDIPKGGYEFRVDGPQPAWQSLLQELGERPAPGEGRGWLKVRRHPNRVAVEGGFDVVLAAVCSRCQEDIQVKLEKEFRANLLQGPQEELAGETELSEEQLDDSILEGDEIDFLALLREQILLEIPFKPLCREDCRGICLDCRAHLNHEVCRCVGKAVDPRLAPLSRLRLEH